MKRLIKVGMMCLATCAMAQEGANGIVHVNKGAAIGTLEDVARTYFAEIAYFDKNAGSPTVAQSAKEMLRDRDHLTPAQADEVIAIARQLAESESAATQVPMVNPAALELNKVCADLAVAKTRDDAVTALTASQARQDAENRVNGARLLGQLKPTTRTAVNKALAAFRDDMESGKPDWSKAKPETIEAFKSQSCAPGS